MYWRFGGYFTEVEAKPRRCNRKGDAPWANLAECVLKRRQEAVMVVEIVAI